MLIGSGSGWLLVCYNIELDLCTRLPWITAYSKRYHIAQTFILYTKWYHLSKYSMPPRLSTSLIQTLDAMVNPSHLEFISEAHNVRSLQ